MTVQLTRTVDIVGRVCQQKKRPFVVAFAAETNAVMDYALSKWRRKGCDMLVVNDVSEGKVFGQDQTEVTVLSAQGQQQNSGQDGAKGRRKIQGDAPKETEETESRTGDKLTQLQLRLLEAELSHIVSCTNPQKKKVEEIIDHDRMMDLCARDETVCGIPKFQGWGFGKRAQHRSHEGTSRRAVEGP